MDSWRWIAAGAMVVCLGCAQENSGKSYLIRHAGIPLAQAVDIAEKNTPGRAVKAELRYLGKTVVYEVEIIDIVNQSKKVSVDAETGRVVQ